MQENYTNTLCHLNAMPLSVALLAGEAGKAKMWQCLGGTSLSLSLSLSLLTLFSTLNLLNTLFLDFLHLSSRAVFVKMARLVILSLCKKAKNSYKLKEKLPILGFSNTQYGKSGFRLKMTSKENTLCYFEMMTNRNAKTMLKLWIATLALLTRNDGYFHLNCFQKFKQSQHKG